VSFSIRAALLALVGVVASACVETEQVPFDIELTGSCAESAKRVDLLLILVQPDKSLCLLERVEVAAEPGSHTIEGGVLDNEEVVLSALAYDEDVCIRCHALVRVKLASELRRYPIELAPSEACAVPEAALAGLGLPRDDFPPGACE
jgi:hypothetical protein